MSGGHFDYQGFKLREILENISTDEKVASRWPMLSKALGALGPLLDDLEHEMDWDLSGDSSIEDDEAFDRKSMEQLRNAVSSKEELLKKFGVVVHPLGVKDQKQRRKK